MAESRQELLAWVNDLLRLNYTKVEQLGTGAAYVQILDSIYGDLPMSRVKFSTKHEYEYLANYKVLQTALTTKKIDKAVPVERLMKCKMQDNLEFLQWLKRFWDHHYPGDGYDAVERRGNHNDVGNVSNVSTSRSAPARRAVTNNGAGNRSMSGANRSMSGRGSGDRLSAANTSLRGPSPDQAVILSLQKELQEERTAVAALEKERDFYFGKLRDIEVLIQQELERAPEAGESQLLKEIQAVLYSTEEGFEIPAEEGHHVEENEYPDETF
ncbi:hypothetical protein DFQ27_006361 [Actinomortierella ambigua]|uniref:Microtubule binding protein n=1 Tax=Actinomortierella ambigua TaxID=1343610 RepID=A0A9P6QLM5_9FUNG|nr:hypothetical protein DFQ26_006646 [Actinomortierella ambigua]KAG0268582.1 hypothetical protein DFQ27_006361 [Actinomortierella ambigua]